MGLPAREHSLILLTGRHGAESAQSMGSMEESDQEASIDFRGFPARFRNLRRLFERIARRVLEDHGATSYAVSISFVDDAEITRLNRERLNRTGPTDVIAFDLSEPGLPLDRVGDVYISKDTALANSARFRVRPEQELMRLVVHGLLHVLGYRDDRPQDARKMKRVQARTLKEFQSFADSDE
jgi:probable rRNA maturation factor